MRWLWLVLLFAALPAGAQTGPQTTYVFPAGARRGTSLAVRVGGRNLPARGMLWVGGEGVRPEGELRDGRAVVRVEAETAVGEREWRVVGPQGASIPRPFVVSDLPEILEAEPNNTPALAQSVTLPIVVNGQFDPAEDRDVFAFSASAGDVITAEVAARRLGSPADVTLTVTDTAGKTLATADRAGDREPRLTVLIPRTGQYLAIVNLYDYAGGPDRVYRLTLSRGPRVAFVFPAGARRGEPTPLTLFGTAPAGAAPPSASWTATLEERSPSFAEIAVRMGDGALQPLRLAADDLPEVLEAEPNDLPNQAQPIELPCIVNGQLGAPGDRDEFRFRARKGDRVVCEVTARALGSPVDSVLTLLDAAGKELQSNDDQGPSPDARVELALPADGEYRVRIADARSSARGGPEFVYRLRVSAPRPQFRLRAASDSVSVPPNGEQKLVVTIDRREGLGGEVTLRAEGLPPGITAAPVTTKSNQAEILLRATSTLTAGPFRIVGEAVAPAGPAPDPPVPSETAAASVPSAVLNNVPVATRTTETLFACVTPPPPFAVTVVEKAVPAGRGTTVLVPVTVTREAGFAGPVSLDLADAPAGFSALPVVIPADGSAGMLPVQVPMEANLNTTQRLTVRGSAVVGRGEGATTLIQVAPKEALVRIQSQQMSLTPEVESLSVPPGGAAALAITIKRPPGPPAPVVVTLEPSPGVAGLCADPVTLAPGESSARLLLRAEKGACLTGLDDRVRLRATTQRDGWPVFADVLIRIALLPG